MHFATRCTGLLLVAAVVTAGASGLVVAGPMVDAVPRGAGEVEKRTGLDSDSGSSGLSMPSRRVFALLPEAPSVRPGNPLRQRHPARDGQAFLAGDDSRRLWRDAICQPAAEPDVVVRHPARRRHCPPEIPDAA